VKCTRSCFTDVVKLRSGLLWLALLAVIAVSVVAWANSRQDSGVGGGKTRVESFTTTISDDPGAFRELQGMCTRFRKEFPGSQRRLTVPARGGGSATLKCGGTIPH